MLADIELQFVSGEQDPVKHLRAIVSRGHISGMMVYPDYFLVLGGKIGQNDIYYQSDRNELFYAASSIGNGGPSAFLQNALGLKPSPVLLLFPLNGKLNGNNHWIQSLDTIR